MQDTIVTIYCLCHDLLQAVEYQDDPQTNFTSAQVMTVPLVAARFFGGNVDLARRFLLEHGYIRQPLSKSRLNRRLHAMPLNLWQMLFEVLGQLFKAHNPTAQCTVDSMPLPACHCPHATARMPLPACDNIRIRRCRLFRGTRYRGYCASKRRYFYGLKVHLLVTLVTGDGAPIEFVLTPGAVADMDGFKCFNAELKAGTLVHGDRAYTDYGEEELLLAAGEIVLQPQRKSNAKRRVAPWIEALARPVRQRIESTFSQLEALLPRHIRAVTAQGFILKVVCFLLVVSLSYLNA